MGKISREDRTVMALRVATYEWGKMEFTLLSEAICRPKVVQIAPRSTYKKSGRWITNWQFLLVKVVCVTFFESSQPVWDVPVRIHVACYLFVNIKLASYHLLLYVVYLCQKSYNFIDAFVCYKQKCEVMSLNLAHPVLANKSQWSNMNA